MKKQSGQQDFLRFAKKVIYKICNFYEPVFESGSILILLGKKRKTLLYNGMEMVLQGRFSM